MINKCPAFYITTKKILEKYNSGDPSSPIRLYRNQEHLGVLKNKARVVSLANPTNFIALIDSDNFVGEYYFHSAKRFIKEKKITRRLFQKKNSKPSSEGVPL